MIGSGWRGAAAQWRVRRVLGPRRNGWPFLLLVALCGLCSWGDALSGPNVVPAGLVVVPVLLGSLVLSPWLGRLLMVAAAVSELGDFLDRGESAVRPGAWVTLLLIAVIAERISVTRARLGVPGLRGESILAELRDRLHQQGVLAPLPGDWHHDVVLHQSGGSSFGGDFLVSSLHEATLELALVDVSGKGVAAGTRALQLSGALGGLLGSVPADRFLGAANEFLLRQNWGEGFATAVHLNLDLDSGAFTVAGAGHPPAAQFSGGDGRWQLLEAAGPALGLLDDAKYGAASGQLRRGDALLLYTDGVIEIPGRDLALGIDKLLGEATRLVVHGFVDGASRLLAAVAPTANDDRGLVLLWRS